MRLQDKVAIVTGGGGGMGRGISHCLSREGADVVVADLNLAGAQATVEAVEETEATDSCARCRGWPTTFGSTCGSSRRRS